ncbi:DUF2752 domain-containing protein [Marivirga sp.]|uniref:DUF2752 domain-containing protein n=1 Tax=Marivirga sp. TaxID=2018662 RepID=UPI002D80D4CD|nr:DUF2752 domain-containing protein [Marivirga sp.]HET8861576.1 DUF2752 domain-containing protein [Marivirga sp.]
MGRNRLYMLISGVALCSYLWLVFNLSSIALNVCFFKQITSLPCPACGTTQSVLLLLDGEFHAALMVNPLGLLALILLVLVPLWVLIDSLAGKSTLHSFYIKTEKQIKNRYIASPLVLFMLINWAWNIMKNL